MFGPDSQHLGATLRTALILARYTALVGHARVALGADTLSTLSHGVLVVALSHFTNLLCDARRRLALSPTARTHAVQELSLEHRMKRRPVRTCRKMSALSYQQPPRIL